MNAMHMFDRQAGSKGPRMHRASNDATRCLAVLSGLVSLDSFTIPKTPPRVLVLAELPRPSSKHPFTARITTTDGSILPSEFKTPRSLSTLFAEYEPKAVALNSRGLRSSKSNGVRVWWLSFSTVESLERFTTKIDGSSLSGKSLVVESSITPLKIDE